MDTRALPSDAADLADQAKPFGPRPAAKVDMASLVPPEVAALVDQLDNSGTAPAAAAAEEEDEVATLDFVGDELPFVEHPLRYPFVWDGERRDSVTVRQLTTGEVGKISEEWGRRKQAPKLIDIYAVMTGLPARVLRALPNADGDAVFTAAYGFLPQSYRGEDG